MTDKQQQLFKTRIVPGKAGSGNLFEEEFVTGDRPVECLGMTFENKDNRNRDAKVLTELPKNGWRVVVIWEYSVRRPGIDRQKALDRVCLQTGKFLRSKGNSLEISGPLPTVALERQECS